MRSIGKEKSSAGGVENKRKDWGEYDQYTLYTSMKLSKNKFKIIVNTTCNELSW